MKSQFGKQWMRKVIAQSFRPQGESLMLLFDQLGQSKGMKYKVVLNQTVEGYSVSCPALPGCWSQGETESEAIDNIRSAIIEYLAAVNETLSGAEVREIEVTG
jgi:predicted RNase H-like HicB family nuclease